MKWKITPAVPAQAEALSAIHRDAFPPREAWGPDAIALELALPGTLGLVETRGGMIMARVAVNEAEVLTLGVAKSLRRRGLGAALLRACMRKVRAQGAAAVFLEVAINNHPARTLYERAGFLEVGSRRRYYPDGSDALVLRADLSRPR